MTTEYLAPPHLQIVWALCDLPWSATAWQQPAARAAIGQPGDCVSIAGGARWLP